MKKVAALVIVVAAVAMYAPTIHDYFLQDDFGVVGLFSQRSIALFPRWFVAPWTEDIWGYVPDEIRPFPAASYVIASWFGAASPEPNHLLNIAIHALNGLLVMGIAEDAAGLGALAAGAAGLVFVVLPIQAESVAWITGRVDSLPACFYFAAFLLYVRDRYWWSVALFFAALFSKQNTITMAPALIAFDWLVRRRRFEISVRWLRPYVPYIVLTVAFLALRYVLFHEVARENVLNAQRVREFFSDSSKHLVRLVFGGPGVREWTLRDTLSLGVSIAIVVAIVVRAAATVLWRPAAYFGLVWITLGMAPILVSGYYSPRHMYLASLGWAVSIGIAIEAVWQSNPARIMRAIAIAASVAAAFVYGVQLRGVVREWNQRAAISHAAVDQIDREAMAAPQNTLIIAGVPGASWNFAIPHSLRPPFTRTDVTQRAEIISDSSNHCCDAVHWMAYTRNALQKWQVSHAPVVALYWDTRTGMMSRVSDQNDPQLRTSVVLLARATAREQLDQEIRGLFNGYVALR
jgi:hypothetical protein